jgi:hypothetical protein
MLPFSAELGLTELLERMAWYRKSKLPSKALMRALLLECETNLALLRLVDLGNDAAGQQDPAYLDIAMRLQGSTVQLLLGVGDQAEKAFDVWSEIPLVLPEDQESQMKTGDSANSVTTSDRIRRLVISLHSVRVAAEIIKEAQSRDGVSPALRQVRIRQRLQNLNVLYSELATGLRLAL